MKNDTFAHTVVSRKDFDSTIDALQAEIERHEMRVLYVHDVQATLAKKELVREPFKMIEFCKAEYAHTLLETDPRAGIFLPCKISVYVQGGTTFVSALDLDAIEPLFADETVKRILGEANGLVREIVNSVRA